MRVAEPYARAARQEPYDAIVIGSGIGGLGAAALLAKYGKKRVLVLERHYTLGGFTHVFRRPGYEWDVGVHYIGEVQPGTMLRGIFDAITDGRLDWEDMGDVYDRIVVGEEVFEFPKGKENLKARLTQRFPDEASAIDAYFALVEKVVAGIPSFYMEKALPAALAAVAGPLLRRKLLKLSDQTTREVLESLTGNQRLIAILTAQWGNYGLPPAESSFAVHALVTHHYYEGAYYPIGGAGRIAETIVPTIAAAGGKVLINASVAEVVLEKRRVAGVRMAQDGVVIRAPIVISDAGAANTFHRLVPAESAAGFRLSEPLRTLRASTAHLCLYVGLKHSAAELGLPRANIWVYPDHDHERTVATLGSVPEAPLPFVYVSFPSAKDPDFERRHPGRATIDIITAAPYERFARWEETAWKKRGADYGELKERLARQLLETLYHHVPQVRDKIDLYELSTPLTTRHFCNYSSGEMYGLDHTPARFRQRSLRPQTQIPGLYLTGQDVSTCGVAGALLGGVLSASAILRRNLLRAVLRGGEPPTGDSRRNSAAKERVPKELTPAAA